MPQISRFFGIIISMYFDDHNPPHFHVNYGEFDGKINIKDLSLMEGYLPPRVMGLVIEWASKHQQELLGNWKNIEKGIKLQKIIPLD